MARMIVKLVLLSSLWVALTAPLCFSADLPNEVEIGHLESYLNPLNRDSIYVDRDILFGTSMTYEDHINIVHGFAGVICGSFLVMLFLKNL